MRALKFIKGHKTFKLAYTLLLQMITTNINVLKSQQQTLDGYLSNIVMCPTSSRNKVSTKNINPKYYKQLKEDVQQSHLGRLACT